MRDGTTQVFRSRLERDALIRLDFCERAAWIITQPFTVVYTHDERRRRYTPDIYVARFRPASAQHADRGLLVEVKPKGVLEKERSRLEPAFAIGRHVAATDLAVPFEIWTEERIYGDSLTENAGFLRRYFPTANRAYRADHQALMLAAIREHPGITPSKLINACFPHPDDQPEAVAALWALLAMGAVGCDLSRRLDTQLTALYLPEHPSCPVSPFYEHGARPYPTPPAPIEAEIFREGLAPFRIPKAPKGRRT